MSSYSSEVTKKRCHLDLCVQTSGSLFSTCLIQLQIVNQTLSLVLQVVVGWLVSCFEGTKNCFAKKENICSFDKPGQLVKVDDDAFSRILAVLERFDDKKFSIRRELDAALGQGQVQAEACDGVTELPNVVDVHRVPELKRDFITPLFWLLLTQLNLTRPRGAPVTS